MRPNDPDALWDRVAIPPNAITDCWEWLGRSNNARSSAGVPFRYGMFSYGGRSVLAHRMAFELLNGPISAGAVVMHTCDRPSCVKPMHLRVGTQADNVADRDAKHRLVHLRGSQKPMAKITEADVVAMRERYAAGGVTQREVGAPYGLTQMQVSNIVLRKHWRHVA